MRKFSLKESRFLAGLTQVEMAEKLGVSESTYIKYEQYKQFMRMDIAFKFSQITKRSLDEIIFLPDNYILNVVATK